MEILVISMALITLGCLYVSVKLLGAYAVAHAETRRAGNLGFVPGETKFADLTITEDLPIRVPVGAKYLHVNTFTYGQYHDFMNAFIGYLQTIKKLGLSIDFLSVVDGVLEPVAMDTVLTTNKEAAELTKKFVARWLLPDKEMNPHKITKKYFMANIKPTTLLSLLSSLKHFNLDTVKKKGRQIEAMLTGIETSDISLSGPVKHTDGASSKSVIPNFPNYSSWLAEEGKVVTFPNEK